MKAADLENGLGFRGCMNQKRKEQRRVVDLLDQRPRSAGFGLGRKFLGPGSGYLIGD